MRISDLQKKAKTQPEKAGKVVTGIKHALGPQSRWSLVLAYSQKAPVSPFGLVQETGAWGFVRIVWVV